MRLKAPLAVSNGQTFVIYLTVRRHGSAAGAPLSACEPILSLPGVLRVGVGGPEKLRDVVRIEVRPRLNGTGDRDGRGVDAVLPDAGGNQRLRRAQGGLPHREARQCGHWIVGEADAGDQKGAAAGCPQDGRGYLCRDDGAEDIDVVGGSEPPDGGLAAAQFRARPGRCPWGSRVPSESNKGTHDAHTAITHREYV